MVEETTIVNEEDTNELHIEIEDSDTNYNDSFGIDYRNFDNNCKKRKYRKQILD
jgi:hypothetical protein